MHGTLKATWKLKWTAEQIELLRLRLAEGGRSYSAIAAELGTTRNAVAGKVLRLGLSLAPTEVRARRAHNLEKNRKPYSGRRMKISLLTGQPIAKKPSFGTMGRTKPICEPDPIKRSETSARSYWPYGSCTVLELTETSCRWPVSAEPPHLFCNADAVKGEPYCTEHCRIAYTVHARGWTRPDVTARLRRRGMAA